MAENQRQEVGKVACSRKPSELAVLSRRSVAQAV